MYDVINWLGYLFLRYRLLLICGAENTHASFMKLAPNARVALTGCLLFFVHFAYCQVTYRIEGYVRDTTTQEPLPGVTILVENTGTGTVSDEEGFYQLSRPFGDCSLLFSFISYEKANHSVRITADTVLNVTLSPSYILTDEVVVYSTPADEHTKQSIDRIEIDAKTLNEIPYLLGEVDPVKAVQLLPGVQAAGDGNTGFYVRGGGADQNLILLDKATIYNASHLFGFFSVFNGNTVDNVSLTKGGIPAYYGGRLSSVLAIDTKSGSFQKWHGKGSLGLIATNLALEGPLVQDKLSISVAGRRTYYDLISRPLNRHVDFLKNGLNYYFYDLNATLDYRLSDRDRITLSSYTGNDKFQYSNFGSFSNRIGWGNQALSLRWHHVYTPQLLSETSVTYTRYRMDFGATISSYHLQLASAVRDIAGEHTFTYTPSDRHELTGGIHLTRHRFSPSDAHAEADGTGLDFGEAEVLHAREGAVYLNERYEISSRWTLSGGVRLTGFQHRGPFRRYENAPPGVAADTTFYQPGVPVVGYLNAEPRLAVVYQLSTQASLKLAYDRAYQYTHMVPLASTSLPTDVWVPSSEKIKPQRGNQYSLGYFTTVGAGAYEGSLMVYYKGMHNQIEYRDGVLVGQRKGSNYDDNFLFGRGRSYGSELFIKKKKGFLTGWLSYTLSKTDRAFAEIDEGKSYPAQYDRRHDLSLLLNYRRHSRWSFSGVFAFASGNTTTLPVARYVINGNVVNEYDGRNNFRMPAYHRMDLSATYEGRKRERVATSWVFSLYNVYSRLNPYYLFFDVDGDVKEYRLEVKAKQISLFPIIPSVTYRVSF